MRVKRRRKQRLILRKLKRIKLIKKTATSRLKELPVERREYKKLRKSKLPNLNKQ